MILSAQSIRRLSKNKVSSTGLFTALIYPFVEEYVTHGMTAGLSSSGYDIRIDQDIILYPVSLKNLLLRSFGFNRPSFSLASSSEQFCIPKNIMPFVADKSTWARLGLAVQNTCAEPGWSGYLTLELSNHSENIIHIKKGTPIAQIVFYELDFATEKPYDGKYRDQKRGPQPAILA